MSKADDNDMLKKAEECLANINPDEFLDQFLSIVEKQITCVDNNDICDIRPTSFGMCCVKCGLLPDFWKEDNDNISN